MEGKELEILSYYGNFKQTTIWIEELSELIKVICKWQREYDELEGDLSPQLKENFLTEIADVYNCLKQMRKATNTSLEKIYEEREAKNNRQLERIKRGE